MAEQVKDLAYYMALPYTIILKPDEDGTWFAKVAELPGCITVGDDPADALEMIEDAKFTWLEGSLDLGFPIPEPDLSAHIELVRANQKIVEVVGG